MPLRSPYTARISISVQPPCDGRRWPWDFCKTSYGFTGAAASTILSKWKVWQIRKNRKPVARRHVVDCLHDARKGTTRRPRANRAGIRKILAGNWGGKIVRRLYADLGQSHGPLRDIARLSLASRTVTVKSHGHSAVILQWPRHDRAAALRWS